MPDFRAELRPASFRGLSFHMESDDTNSGRRIVTKQAPGRDEPFHEDLGQLPLAFNIQAVIIGGGFVARAAALEAAFLQKGPGTLLHPHYGEVQVVVKEMRRAHSKDTIGEVGFSVSFERYSSTAGLSVLGDTGRQMSLMSGRMFDLASVDFNSALASGILPGFVDLHGLGVLGEFLTFAQDAFRYSGLSYRLNPSNFTSLRGTTGDQVAALFSGIVSNMRPGITPIIGTPAAPTNTDSPLQTMRALVQVANHDVQTNITPTSPSRAAMISNADAVSTLVKTSALAAAGGVARYVQYESREQALSTRNMMSDSLQELRERQLTAGYMPAWQASTDMLVAVTEDVTTRIGRLPRTVNVASSVVRPSLAVANRLYGDDSSIIFERATDIAKRNRVAHPGFVAPRPMEVLLND